MDGLATVVASGVNGPAVCLRATHIWKQCHMRYLRRRLINNGVCKFAGSGRIVSVYWRRKKFPCSPMVGEILMLSGYVNSFYVLLRWQKILCSPSVTEVPMFSVGGSRFYAFLRWKKFLCSPSVAEFSMFYADRSYFLRRWQNFLCSSMLAEVLMVSAGGRTFYVLYAHRSSYVLRRWQNSLCSSSLADFLFFLTVAEISMFFTASRSKLRLVQPPI